MPGERPLLEFPVAVMTKIHSMSLQLVLTCRCGHPEPILLVFLPGVPLTSYCPRCEMKFRLAAINYDAQNPEGLRAAVEEISPTIVTPRTM